MAELFGDKSRFAAEVGDYWDEQEQNRHVDLWAGGRRLTCDDNIAFVPVLCMDVSETVDWLKSGCDLSPPFPDLTPIETHRRLVELDDGSREKYWFPHWGPITDNVTGHLFRIGEQVTITLDFWRNTHSIPEERGVPFAIELPEKELIEVLEQTLTVLERVKG
ncbi:MAG: hypothetical protein KF873_00070 [Gemmataceae bacterium]|nr:hypothetical protein [Gemmataceae bacterium]